MTDRIDQGLATREREGLIAYALAERLFVAALRNAVAWFEANPAAWSRVLPMLDQAELANLPVLWTKRPPVIRAGFARTQDPMPLVCVALADERVSDEFLGDTLGLDENLAEFGGRGLDLGAIYQQTLRISVWSDHPDVCLYLYHWARYSLTAHVDWFDRQHLIAPRLEAGGEVEPDTRFTPQLWTRVQTWSCRGHAGAVLPMPDPPRSLLVHLQHITDRGLPGGVTVATPDGPRG